MYKQAQTPVRTGTKVEPVIDQPSDSVIIKSQPNETSLNTERISPAKRALSPAKEQKRKRPETKQALFLDHSDVEHSPELKRAKLSEIVPDPPRSVAASSAHRKSSNLDEDEFDPVWMRKRVDLVTVVKYENGVADRVICKMCM